MKNNRSFAAMLSALWVSMTSGFRSKGFRRAVGLLLVVANLMTSTGLVLAKEMDDETSETTSGIVTELTEETPSETSEEETSEEPSSDKEDPSDTSDSSETSDTDVTESDETSDTDETSNTDETPSDSDEVTIPDTSDETTSADPTEEPESKKTELFFEDDTYSVYVSYGTDTGIPSNARLVVNEILAPEMIAEYREKLSEVMDADSCENARFFDISLMCNDVECEPAEGTTVSVKIVLKEVVENDISVVHLPDDQEGTVVDNFSNHSLEGTEVNFEADGFSAYAIVPGPAAADAGDWKRVKSLDELEQKGKAGTGGLIFGHPYGFCFTGEQTNKDSRQGIKKTNIGGDRVDPFVPGTDAVPYYVERNGTTNKFRIYCLDPNTGAKKYLLQSGNSLSFDTAGTGSEFTFTANTVDYSTNSEVAGVNYAYTYEIKSGNYYCTVQGGLGGRMFAAYNGKDRWVPLSFWYYDPQNVEPYGLDGKTYALLNWNGSAGGRTLQATSSAAGKLDALATTVVSKRENNEDKLFVSADIDATMWTFEWTGVEDRYYVKTTVNGATKYLSIDSTGLSVSDTPVALQVVPGTGDAVGQLSLQLGANRLTFSGKTSEGFDVNHGNNRFLYLAEERVLEKDYLKTYSAKKISVSDPALENGEQVIVYTRRWNDSESKYEYYAIDHDGSLILCYESGDYLQWTETMINSLLWDFTIYYWENTTPGLKENENGYYELYNEYSQKYIAPQISGGQYLSDEKIGIQLSGRNNNRYYSSIIAWDDPNYSYASLVTNTDTVTGLPSTIGSGSFSEAEDFYFAIVQDATLSDDELHEVVTLDNAQYGITMKMQDFSSKKVMSQFLEGKDNPKDSPDPNQGLLSSKLGTDGYPTVMTGTNAGQSLAQLYNATTDVNHLFIESTHDATGYMEYDSTQNFASFYDKTGHRDPNNFTVYQELGTHDSEQKSTLQHGQFFPYNSITADNFAKKNPQNLYNMNARYGAGNENIGLLDDGNPRKYEQLYLLNGNPDYYFGMEMSTSFIQTPDGLDDWGHDIIFEFTGDDDFWFYVDGELVIDLGGIHSAMAGLINFADGTVVVNGQRTTLYETFFNNFYTREYADCQDADLARSRAQSYVDGIFVQDDEGNYVFTNYSSHDIKLFYMERGAGASNLHMKFNQSAVKPGNVILGKEVSGIEQGESVMADFPYQIFYRLKNDPTQTEYPLTNPATGTPNVVYRDSDDPVPFDASTTIGGVPYSNVFYLKQGEECEITFPNNMEDYRIVECGVSPNIFSKVRVNGNVIDPEVVHAQNGLRDYGVNWDTAKNRTTVQYDNEVKEGALRTLYIQKKLYKEDGVTEIHSSECNESFNFRLYLSGEFGPDITESNKGSYAAYMYKYHVLDEQGNYCEWVAGENGGFRSIGVKDHSLLTAEQKEKVSFQTSMNGSISKIPAGYTVEIHGLMIGSHFMVEERGYEIPDGYSLRSYDYYEMNTNANPTQADLSNPVSKSILAEQTPKVVVNNLKGYGLRIKKEWTDKDFMDSHDDAYFAVYKRVNGQLVLAEMSDSTHPVVRRISNSEDSVYWYYERLDPGLELSDYEIREVKLIGSYNKDSDGIITGYDPNEVIPIEDGQKIEIDGTMTGALSASTYEYTVTYQKGTVPNGSNIRVDKATNDRPGLGLTKTDWQGVNMLQNAEFTVVSTNPSYPFRKKFVSDSNGHITKAFFVPGTIYELTEIKTPVGYYCPTDSIKVKFIDDVQGFEIDTSSSNYFGTSVVQQGNDTLLSIWNMTYTLRVLKVDADDDSPLQGAHFALHKQIKVGSVTMFDYDPVPGYADMVSNADGVLEELDNTLPAGTYELRELQAPLGYSPLSHNVRFVVGDTGGITLLNNYADVTVTSDDSVPGTMAFEMKIKDPSATKLLTVTKTVSGNMGSRDQKFDFTATFSDANGIAYQNGLVNVRYPDGTDATLTLNNSGSATFQLAHGESIRFALPPDTTYTITEGSNEYEATWSVDNGPAHSGKVATGVLTANQTVTFTNTKKAVIPTGIDFTVRAILGAGLLLLIGASAFAVVSRRRRDEDDPEDGDSFLKGIRRV